MVLTDWEQELEERIRRERMLAVELLDAARAIQGTFKPAGARATDAAELFAEKFKAWREAADAITRHAESYLAQR